MLIALPPETWSFVRAYDAAAMAGAMKEVAAHVRVYWMRKASRGPKKVQATKRKLELEFCKVRSTPVEPRHAHRASPIE
jgi:predicted peroxiredoxin